MTPPSRAPRELDAGAIATALVLGEPVGWRLAVSALLVAGGVAAAKVLPAPAVAASAVAPRPVRRSTP